MCKLWLYPTPQDHCSDQFPFLHHRRRQAERKYRRLTDSEKLKSYVSKGVGLQMASVDRLGLRANVMELLAFANPISMG